MTHVLRSQIHEQRVSLLLGLWWVVRGDRGESSVAQAAYHTSSDLMRNKKDKMFQVSSEGDPNTFH